MTIFRSAFLIFLAYALIIPFNQYIRQSRSVIDHNNSKLYRLPLCCYLGLKSIAADLYWFGLSYSDDLSADYVFEMADFITDLDPHYTVVFRYAGIYLTTHAQRSDLAIRLLQKSLNSSVNRKDWRIPFYLAHNYHHAVNDKKKAAIYYQLAAEQSIASELPGYLKNLGRVLSLSEAIMKEDMA